jgi:hypothetical protein
MDVGDEDVGVVPILLDDRYADGNTVILQSVQSSLATTIVVWTGLSSRLPMCVLDRRLGSVSIDVTDSGWIDHAARAGATRGRASVSPLDPVNQVRARIDDALGCLVKATWAPSGTGELGKLLASASVTPQNLVDLLEVSPQTALALRRGQEPATPAQAEKLAPVLQLSPRLVLEANPAPSRGLVQLMSRPRRRAQVNRLADRRGIDERTAWLSATYAVTALAARQTGPQTEPAWDERIDQYFQITLES